MTDLLGVIASVFGWLLRHMIVVFILYHIGWVVVRILTLGRYPSTLRRVGLIGDVGDDAWVAWFGGMVVVLVVAAVI